MVSQKWIRKMQSLADKEQKWGRVRRGSRVSPEEDGYVTPCGRGKHVFAVDGTGNYAICIICQCTADIRLGEVRDRAGRRLGAAF